jgi:hypothetical protein
MSLIHHHVQLKEYGRFSLPLNYKMSSLHYPLSLMKILAMPQCSFSVAVGPVFLCFVRYVNILLLRSLHVMSDNSVGLNVFCLCLNLEFYFFQTF